MLRDEEAADTLLSSEYTDSLRRNDAADARWLLAERVGRALSGAELEGVAFALREGLEALEGLGITAPELRLAGGGASGESGNPWRRLLADVLGRPLRLLPDEISSIASARGAAFLAGFASGEYSSAEDTLPLTPEPERSISPGDTDYEPAYERYKELYARLHE